MASSRNFTCTGVKSTSRSVSTCEGFKILPTNNVLMESSENQVERRLTILENLLRDHLNEENAQVKQLIDRILELDEQLEKNKSTPSSIMTSRSSEPNSLCSDCHPTISAKEPLRRWQLQSQPGRRLVEIKAMFEYKQADPSSLEGSKISSPSNIKEIINRASIKTYFDMICRDGSITAGIGEYLHLSKENIFGGIDCESQYDRVTFVNVDLCQSIINLGNNLFDSLNNPLTFLNLLWVSYYT
ncbi:unnamed protein product [Rotaria magnacalcarata]|uniref:Uncharacterized protein n=1 Tax=Rotaria magnacalcarata TaxID=392030 RepID=A0A817AND1_9BILA|nr:unnamed protein product [Rotaria magnacalcarata]